MSSAQLMRQKFRCLLLIAAMLMQLCARAHSQAWSWTSETVDPDGGGFSSLAIDDEGNVHIGYLSPEGGGTKYGFRSARTGQWFTMLVDKNNGFVSLALDKQQRPHLCYVPYETLKYAYFDGQKWHTQEIAPHSGDREFSCGIAVGPDGAPHVTWYQYTDKAGQLYLHIRHAVLRNGSWQAKTIDFGHETGKWNNVRVDSEGRVYVSYSAFREKAFRFATCDPQGHWSVSVVEDGKAGRKEEMTPGLGNAMILDQNGRPNFSYRDETALHFAWSNGNHWRIDVVDANANPLGNWSWINFRTAVALDANGRPHIAYESDGALKHAWWDGTNWRLQPMGINGPQHRYVSLAISRDNVIYMGYSDPDDGSMKILVGRPENPPATAHIAEDRK